MRWPIGLFAVGIAMLESLAAQQKRPVTLDDLEGVASGKGVISTTLHVASDGRRLAVERGNRLWLLDLKSDRVMIELGEGLLPIWSPSGKRLGFYSNRSGSLQIWMWSAETQQTEQLTSLPGGVDADPTTRVAGPTHNAFRFSWSPDGTRIAFASRVAQPTGEAVVEGAPLVLTNTTPPDLTLSGVFAQPGESDVVEAKDGRTWGYRFAKRGEALSNQLFIVDTRTRLLTQITNDGRPVFHPAWSPDGRAIAIAVSDPEAAAGGAPALNSASKGGEIVALDPLTRKRQVLAAGGGIKHRPKWSRDGSKVAFLSSVAQFADPTIRIVRGEDGQEQGVLQLDRKIADYEWVSSGTDEFLVQYYDGIKTKLARFDLGSHSVSTLAPHIPIAAATWSLASSGLIAWLETHAASQVWLLHPGASKPTQLIDLNPGSQELSLGRIERITWRNKRGDAIEGRLLYPPDYRKGRKYPAIIDAYPLGVGGMRMHPMSGNQAWASVGYVVFEPMPRSPHVWQNCSRGVEFCRASKGPEAWNVMFDDLMSGIDELIGRGVVDPDRMCLYGHSNGASTVNYLVTKTNRFKCAVSVASSMSDWASVAFLNTEEWITELAGVPPWQDPNAYIQLSAVFQVGKVTTPMLLAAGDKDGGFLLGTIRMYNALRQTGADVTFLRYPDQGHLFTGAAMRDFWEREMAFFDKHLRAAK